MSNLCAYCGKPHGRDPSSINRSKRLGVPIYCNRKCFGLSRRKHKTKEQKVKEKQIYDAIYRERNAAAIKARKSAYFKRSYDPVKAAEKRKKTMARHVEYCRQPKYKAYKSNYDKQRRDREYGPFAEVARLTINLNREIKQRMTNYEIRSQNQTLNKRQTRTRTAAETPSRERNSRTQG